MWQLTVNCSDEGCGEVFEVMVDDLDEVDGVVCECGHNVILLRIASFEPATIAA